MLDFGVNYYNATLFTTLYTDRFLSNYYRISRNKIDYFENWSIRMRNKNPTIPLCYFFIE